MKFDITSFLILTVFILINRWGFDLYPERRGENYKPTISRKLFLGEGAEAIGRFKCEERVLQAVKKSKIMHLNCV